MTTIDVSYRAGAPALSDAALLQLTDAELLQLIKEATDAVTKQLGALAAAADDAEPFVPIGAKFEAQHPLPPSEATELSVAVYQAYIADHKPVEVAPADPSLKSCLRKSGEPGQKKAVRLAAESEFKRIDGRITKILTKTE